MIFGDYTKVLYLKEQSASQRSRVFCPRFWTRYTY